ncbi:ImmA/IrrE family metallo-endopeptidase [Iodobacter fluviatilis]|uniref:Domain of uncharacterized function (DUF955) n=1 Tax=Iodobacter fluviatilis TaxID=537 RepID=A0A377Q7K0_9NEIS|nr:ImmA/IrrE family metallo-endopeptidase [Iodobacter fluviatilis]TCU89523.1 restriction endonuclease [Iodobacter fluviatilis]STQ90893.1 Domain of uncharacterised function (DUF955) [Iodobacter fluviatilis]
MKEKINTTQIGDKLEDQIFNYFKEKIDSDSFYVKRTNCQIFKKKGYYSKDRGSNIIFDISIEIFYSDPDCYTSLILIECKNYSHNVPVDDTEEFFAKVQQVGPANSKAIIVSTAAFQSGAQNFARSKGMGLVRYFPSNEIKWILHRTPSQLITQKSIDITQNILSHSNNRSQFFNFYIQTPLRLTTALCDLIEDLTIDSSLAHEQTHNATKKVRIQNNSIHYITKDVLEEKCTKILNHINYYNGEVSLEKICLLEEDNSNLKVHIYDESSPISDSILGQITFSPPEIKIYKKSCNNHGQLRFTLAHELAHHLLEHKQYMLSETCEENDFSTNNSCISDDEIERLEFQANHFAACLLMPQKNIVNDFYKLIEHIGVKNKGFGMLYVDDQQCNIKNYNFITNALANKYGVSQAAVSIRLKSLQLLFDKRFQ